MARLSFFAIFFWIKFAILSYWLVSGDINPSTMVLPDDVIHGTQRHRFEMHDLSDVAGGKWKAVHIPDEDISSLLKISNGKKGNKTNLDIEHDLSTKGIPPVEVHGRVHAFDNSLSSKNRSRSLGNILVAMENEDRGKEALPLHGFIRKNIKLPDHPKEKHAKNREIHPKTVSRPSLIVAKTPDGDDDSEDNLPLEKLQDPIVASLRKTSPKIRTGASRSTILAQLETPSSSSNTRSTTRSPLANGTSSRDVSGNNKAINGNEASQESKDPKSPKVLDKIKSILLKSHSESEDVPIIIKPPRKSEQKYLEVSAPVKEPSPHRNSDGLFLSPSNSQANAFSNHAAVVNKISSSRKEALLVGIIKALLSRDKMKMSANGMNTNTLPHYNKQAILQGIQRLKKKKPFANAQNKEASPAVAAGNPASVKNLDEVYQKQRDQQVKQELARANEESFEARKMNQQEDMLLDNYDHFMNPESRTSWKHMSPEKSTTANGQEISLMGIQQMNMLEDNPSPS